MPRTARKSLRNEFSEMVKEGVDALCDERQLVPTDRAVEARKESRRRRIEDAEARDRALIAAALAEADSVRWGVNTFAASWEQWAGWVRAILDVDPKLTARSFDIHLWNGNSIGMIVPPRGCTWVFWPPHEEGIPEELMGLWVRVLGHPLSRVGWTP